MMYQMNTVKETRPTNRLQHLGEALFCLVCGFLVFVVFGHYYPVFAGTLDGLGRVMLAGLLLALASLARGNERFHKYWLLLFAYFTALTAISVDYYLGFSHWLLPPLGLTLQSPPGLAIDKLESSITGILIVLILNQVTSQKLAALYIRRGHLRLGLATGLATFGLMLAAVIPITELLFKGENLSWGRILMWMPWVLIMVFSNATYEELVFRGLFIGKLESFLGRFTVNLVTTIPFVLNHVGNNYMSNTFIFFLLQLLPLSLVWCWLTQKTNSLWSAILFHAAMDIPVFVGIFSRL